MLVPLLPLLSLLSCPFFLLLFSDLISSSLFCLWSFSNFLIPRTRKPLRSIGLHLYWTITRLLFICFFFFLSFIFLISSPISMNSSYHSSFPPFSIDLNEDLYHDNQLQPVAAYASSSLPNYPFFINPSPQEAGYYQRKLQPAQLQDQANIYVSGHGKGSFCDHQTLNIKNDDAAVICKEEEGNIGNQQGDHRSLKWVSSKMRLMKKMISSDDQTTTVVALPAAAASSIQKFDHDLEDQKKIISPPQPDNNSSSSSSNNNNTTTTTTIRVCSDCNTTKTPLWRSGPRGPKSLCNACGIRQRKARRAMAAAAAAAGSTIFGANNIDHEMQPVKANVQIQKKEKKPISTGNSSNNNNNNNNSHLPFKKRCTQKAARAARKMNINSSKICLEDLTIILSKKYSSSFQRVFPQDEKDAAILLMALSYGALVHG